VVLTPSQRLRQGELAQEFVELGIFPGMVQELTGNYINTLTALEPSDNVGREHIAVKLTVLADVVNEISTYLGEMRSDGEIALNELQTAEAVNES